MTDELRDHALQYAAVGYEVFPLKPDKTPLTAHGMKEATTNAETVDNWWRQHPHALIGCRIAPTVVVLDIDPRHGGDTTWRTLQDHYGPIQPARSHLSGRGDNGFHAWFLRPDGKLTARGLHEFARTNNCGHAAGQRSWTSGIDVLHHQHRYTILPPSPHPATGKPYTWQASGEPERMPPWLAHYIVAAAPPSAATTTSLTATTFDDSIADWYSANHTWSALLTAAGWTLVAGNGDDDGSLWRHPNASAPHSASVRHGCLFVYTPNTDFPITEDGDPNGITRFRAYAELHHGGDMRQAARAAREIRTPTTLSTAPTHTFVDEPDSDDTEPASDWDRVDLVTIATEILDGTRQREIPTVVEVVDAMPLFYRGRVNQLHGASGDGKSWVALHACVEAIQAGKLAMFVDWEDNPDGVAARLLALGCTPEQIALLDYRNPSSGLGSTLAFEGLADAPQRDYAVVVIDSTGEAMAAGGVDGNIDAEVAAWFRHAKQIARWPSLPAVILIDHVPKAVDAPAGAIGSQRKTAAITGASYRTTQTKPFAIGRSGLIRLTVLKDRLGHRPKGSTACEAHITADGDRIGICCRISEAQEAAAKGEQFRPTTLMERVSRWLELYPNASAKAIEDNVSGKASGIRLAVATLIDEGWIETERGERGAILHRIVTPFHCSDDDLVPPRPTSSPPRPGTRSRAGDHLVPLVPPLIGGRGTRSPDVGKDEVERIDLVPEKDKPTIDPEDDLWSN